MKYQDRINQAIQNLQAQEQQVKSLHQLGGIIDDPTLEALDSGQLVLPKSAKVQASWYDYIVTPDFKTEAVKPQTPTLTMTSWPPPAADRRGLYLPGG